MVTNNNQAGKSDFRGDSHADGLSCFISDCKFRKLTGRMPSAWFSRSLNGRDAFFLAVPTVKYILLVTTVFLWQILRIAIACSIILNIKDLHLLFW